ncbi:MAG TPA: 1,2-phenylacetyl-CoA epoxidase subunit PaaE [Acetobacteraceae bacterium]|nr:1,2-phenylacetyl-CoA epoxidase subunit PaaE [Acetobacteraceae bacterium]
MTPRFHSLSVADVRRETPDAVSVAFDVPAALAADYAFAPGQYLTLRTTIDGEEIRRSYSICSGLDDGELRIAIRRNPGGIFSNWMNECLRAGDAIDVMTPTGRFGTAIQPAHARTHLAIAAGAGITPVISILRSVLRREKGSRFVLLYGSRTTEDILFRDALAELKDRHMARLSIVHVLSREEQDLSVLTGRLDGERVRALLATRMRGISIDAAYVCGPEAMLEESVAALRDFGLDAARIHTERFVSALGGRPRAAPAPVPDAAPLAVATLRVDGRVREVAVAAGEAVLDAALRAGLDMPFACKGGMCSTCRARLTEGRVEMAVNYALEDWELAAGFVLTCQARPVTERVALDYDQV